MGEITDTQWLLAHLPDATDDDLEYFLERVGMMIPDFFCTIKQVNDTREIALEELKVKHKQL